MPQMVTGVHSPSEAPEAATQPLSPIRTVSDLLRELGSISAHRILLAPPPGTATEQDVLRLVDGDQKRLVELVDRTLVEKPVGWIEGLIAAEVSRILGNFVREHRLGIITGPDSMLRMSGGNIRMADVAFHAWASLPNRRVPRESIPMIAADLAVEVLSDSNTRAEMARKREEYFASGGKLVWEVDPSTRTVAVFSAPEQRSTLTENDVLEGVSVLPGLTLPVRAVFAVLDLSGD